MPIDDWATDVADTLIRDIPQVAVGGWKPAVTAAIAGMLREQLSKQASRGRLNTFAEQIVRDLPEQLPEHVTTRFRAKLLGALVTAGALGKHFNLGRAAGGGF